MAWPADSICCGVNAPLNGEVALFVESGDLMVVDVGEGVEIVCPSGRVVEGMVHASRWVFRRLP